MTNSNTPGASGLERISVACGNIPALGLRKLCVLQRICKGKGAYGNSVVALRVRVPKNLYFDGKLHESP